MPDPDASAVDSPCAAAAENAMADWLSLAAAPTFAIMALSMVVPDGGRQGLICTLGHAASPWNGMVTMYWLMSAFHLAPWLKLVKK